MLIIVDRSRTTHFFSLPPPSRRVLQFHLEKKESSAYSFMQMVERFRRRAGKCGEKDRNSLKIIRKSIFKIALGELKIWTCDCFDQRKETNGHAKTSIFENWGENLSEIGGGRGGGKRDGQGTEREMLQLIIIFIKGTGCWSISLSKMIHPNLHQTMHFAFQFSTCLKFFYHASRHEYLRKFRSVLLLRISSCAQN